MAATSGGCFVLAPAAPVALRPTMPPRARRSRTLGNGPRTRPPSPQRPWAPRGRTARVVSASTTSPCPSPAHGHLCSTLSAISCFAREGRGRGQVATAFGWARASWDNAGGDLPCESRALRRSDGGGRNLATHGPRVREEGQTVLAPKAHHPVGRIFVRATQMLRSGIGPVDISKPQFSLSRQGYAGSGTRVFEHARLSEQSEGFIVNSSPRGILTARERNWLRREGGLHGGQGRRNAAR